MHTVVRLSLSDHAVPRKPWIALFITALLLTGLAAFGIWRAATPFWLAFALFVASILMVLTAAWFAFVARDAQRLDVVLDDGTTLAIQKPGRHFITPLHQAMLRAMDWHHGNPATGRQGARTSQADTPQAGNPAAGRHVRSSRPAVAAIASRRSDRGRSR